MTAWSKSVLNLDLLNKFLTIILLSTLFRDESKDGYSTLTTVDGLSGIDLSTIERDVYGNLWIGGSSPFGFIQIYNFNIGSIDVFDFGLTEITDFYIDSENTYAAFYHFIIKSFSWLFTNIFC